MVQQYSSLLPGDVAGGQNPQQHGLTASSSHEPLLQSSHCTLSGTSTPKKLSEPSRSAPVGRRYNGNALIPQLGIEPVDKEMDAGWL
jgi:hypothetical protein